jgi:hypothetical protein
MLSGCTHAKCNNCFAWAMRWREDALEAAREGEGRMFGGQG